MFQKDGILKKVIKKEFLNLEAGEKFFDNKYFKPKSSSSDNFEEFMMDIDRKTWLVDESLLRMDKMSMSSGLEARVPLLDKNIVEFSSKIPVKYKIGLFNKKIILKNAFRKKFPGSLLNQPKRGWFSPGAKWLRNEKFSRLAKEILSKNYCQETREVFNWKEMDEIFEHHLNKKEYNFNIIWSILIFQIWVKKFNVKI